MSPLAKNEKGAQLAKGRARIIEHKKIATKLPPSCKARFARLLIRKVCQLIIYALWYNGLKIEKKSLVKEAKLLQYKSLNIVEKYPKKIKVFWKFF